jgi:hypothetical protein
VTVRKIAPKLLSYDTLPASYHLLSYGVGIDTVGTKRFSICLTHINGLSQNFSKFSPPIGVFYMIYLSDPP